MATHRSCFRCDGDATVRFKLLDCDQEQSLSCSVIRRPAVPGVGDTFRRNETRFIGLTQGHRD